MFSYGDSNEVHSFFFRKPVTKQSDFDVVCLFSKSRVSQVKIADVYPTGILPGQTMCFLRTKKHGIHDSTKDKLIFFLLCGFEILFKGTYVLIVMLLIR